MSDDGRPNRPSLAGACPLCGTPLDLNSSACRRCGVAPKRVGLCVHCKSTSSVRSHPELGWVCDVCGGARLVHPALEQEGAVQSPLAAATHDHRAARLLRVASGAGATLSALTFLGLLVIGSIFGLGGAVAAFTSIPLLVSLLVTVVTFAKARSLRTRTALSLEQAQTAALVKLLGDYPEGALAAQLASMLQISHSRAEQLLTRLNVRDDIQSMVADDGQLLFRLRNGDEISSDPFAPPAIGRLRLPTENVTSPYPDPSGGVSSEREDTAEQEHRAERPPTKEAR